jgi:hypothetical protein
MHGSDKAMPANATPSETPDLEWVDAMRAHLRRAAELAVEHGCHPAVFSQAASDAYMSQNPSLREQLEAMHLAAQLAVLRSQGRVADA